MSSTDPFVPIFLSFHERFNEVTDKIIKTQGLDQADIRTLQGEVKSLVKELDHIKKVLEAKSVIAKQEAEDTLPKKWMFLKDCLAMVLDTRVLVAMGIFVLLLINAHVDIGVLLGKLIDWGAK